MTNVAKLYTIFLVIIMKFEIPKSVSYYYDEKIKKYVFSFLGKNYFLDDIESIDKNKMLSSLGYECIVNITDVLHEGFKELHHHDFYEILYIKKGNFIFRVDEQVYNVSQGDVLLVNPFTLHVLTQFENVIAERVVINVTEKFINNISTEQSNLLNIFQTTIQNKNYRIHLSQDSQKKMDSYVDTVIKTQGSLNFGDDVLYKLKMTQILLLLNNHQIELESTDLITQNKIVADCVSYITSNLSNPITIELIAESINVSPSTISHTFKKHTGISIYRFITKKRMILAKKLIMENVSLQDIYQICGFNDYTSFFRCFKKEFNQTPKEFKLNSL